MRDVCVGSERWKGRSEAATTAPRVSMGAWVRQPPPVAAALTVHFFSPGSNNQSAQPPAPVRPPPSATPAPGPGVCASPWQRVPSTSANNPHRPGWSCEGQMQVPHGPSEPSPTSQPVFLLAILIPACVSSSPAFLMMYSAYKLNKQGDNIQP